MTILTKIFPIAMMVQCLLASLAYLLIAKDVRMFIYFFSSATLIGSVTLN